MLFVHEVHSVRGDAEEAFEALYRDGWLPALAGTDARLLYYLDHVHGTGASYRVVTITAVRDASAWAMLTRRLDDGDLRSWQRDLDATRHDVRSKILVPLPWSPLQDVEFDAVPTDPVDGPMAIFMEDTVWPHEGKFDEYIERSGSHYAPEIDASHQKGTSILDVRASFRSTFGTHRRYEIILWQRVMRDDLLLGLLTHRVPESYRKPGLWMHDALEIRDQWESRLLRTSPWSPWR